MGTSQLTRSASDTGRGRASACDPKAQRHGGAEERNNSSLAASAGVLDAAQGLLLTAAFYWDLNDQTRAWAKKFADRYPKVPTMIHAGTYGAATHYLNAVAAAGTDDGGAVVARMKGDARRRRDCNWLQHFENAADPYHLVVLHEMISGDQFKSVLTWSTGRRSGSARPISG